MNVLVQSGYFRDYVGNSQIQRQKLSKSLEINGMEIKPCTTSYKCNIKIGTKNYYKQTIRTLELEY